MKIILKKLPIQPQLYMFKTLLASFTNPQHELCLLTGTAIWKHVLKQNGKIIAEVTDFVDSELPLMAQKQE